MSTAKRRSPARKEASRKFQEKMKAVKNLRYASMRRVPFHGWKDVGRFAEYAQHHLEIAESAVKQLGYWETMYALLSGKESVRPDLRGLSEDQQKELAELEVDLKKMPESERTKLGEQIRSQHGETVRLLREMADEGILPGSDFKETGTLTVDGEKAEKPDRTEPKRFWAIARDQEGKPLIKNGCLELHETKPPSLHEDFKEALSQASKYRKGGGEYEKVGFFLGYTAHALTKHLSPRAYANQLSEREARQIQATNKMISYMQQQWNRRQSMNPSQPCASHTNKVEQIPATKEVRPSTIGGGGVNNSLPDSTNTIVNNITIHGAMNGDIGYQRNQPPLPYNGEAGVTPRPFPSRPSYTSPRSTEAQVREK